MRQKVVQLKYENCMILKITKGQVKASSGIRIFLVQPVKFVADRKCGSRLKGGRLKGSLQYYKNRLGGVFMFS